MHTKRYCLMFVGCLGVENALSAGGCPLGGKKKQKNPKQKLKVRLVSQMPDRKSLGSSTAVPTNASAQNK